MRVASEGPPPLPTHVRVGPYLYTVHSDAARMSDLRNDSSEGNRVGQIYYQKLAIDIDPTLAHDRKVSALLHEVLHASWHFANFDPDNEGKISEEQVVSGLERILLAVLRDNPDLVAYLTDCRDV